MFGLWLFMTGTSKKIKRGFVILDVKNNHYTKAKTEYIAYALFISHIASVTAG